jgi:hypothetical protein
LDYGHKNVKGQGLFYKKLGLNRNYFILSVDGELI